MSLPFLMSDHHYASIVGEIADVDKCAARSVQGRLRSILYRAEIDSSGWKRNIPDLPGM
jgi:hypothetical protein